MQSLSDKVLGALENVMVISTTDLQGNITYVNDLFCKLTGYSRDELLGQPHSIVRHASVPKSTYKQMWDTIKKGEIWTGVIPNVGKNGGLYVVDTTVQPVFDPQGSIVEFISIRRVINDLMSDFEALEFSKEQFDEYYDR